jgi:hypothetical protein
MWQYVSTRGRGWFERRSREDVIINTKPDLEEEKRIDPTSSSTPSSSPCRK